MNGQMILRAAGEYAVLDAFLQERNVRKIFLVCGRSLSRLPLGRYFEDLPRRTGTEVVTFRDFQPNPLYESVEKGVALFNESGCDIIIAAGGGSAMDVAKCIKLYSNMDPAVNYLKQEIVPNDVFLMAIPTTAGTGSEATRYAVVYYEGSKQSVAHESIIPQGVLLDSSLLATLPLYQKKVTMLDALMHAVESFWSVNSTEESRAFSRKAIQKIMAHREGYLANREADNAAMQEAAFIAGQAINITQTTAGHAMCYKLTSLFGTSHGYAAALCDRVLFPWMMQHPERCIDPRGPEFLDRIYKEIADAMGCKSPEEAADALYELVRALDLEIPAAREADYQVLKTSVNPVRLKNHPVRLDEDTIDALYHEILKQE